MQHAGAAVISHAKVAQHDVTCTMQILIAQLYGRADADVKKGSIRLGTIPH